jgi:hypothetical protein
MPVYYALFGFVFILGILAEQPRFDGVMTLFVIAIVLSLVGNTIPAYFQAGQRFVSFLLVFCLLSPWFFNASLVEVRMYVFKYTNLLLIGVVVLSFLGSVSGAFPGIGRSDMFEGLTTHSMLLAPVAGVVMLIAIWRASQQDVDRATLFISIAVVLICLYTMLLAGSRGSLLGSVGAGIVLLLLAFRRTFSKIIKLVAFVFILLIATVPYWSSYTENIDKKNEYAEEQGDDFASRSELWGYRYEEFQESPVIGIGFASAKKGEINTKNGQIEPGTSWGALFAQIGVLGAFPLIVLFLSYFKQMYRKEDAFNKGKLLIAMLLFFTVHMVVEGYILGSGSFMFFYVWLLLGVIKNRNKEQEVIVY